MRLRVEQIAKRPDVVWALDFIDADTMLFTERGGRVGRLQTRTGDVTYLAGAPAVFAEGSSGLFDVLVDPRFAENGFVYFTFVKRTGEVSATAVARGRLDGDGFVEVRELFVANNGSDEHAHWGSRVVMDSSRHLFISIGDRHVPENAQRLDSHGGKILRLRENGDVPADNPFVGRDDASAEIWSYGHRNPQGLAFQPNTDRLFENEHGPTGGDEINVIERGRNYGWPVITYGSNIWGGRKAEGTARDGMEQPVKYFPESIAPSGLTFCTGKRYPDWAGDAFSSTLRGHLNRVSIDGSRAVGEERLLEGWPERVRDVAEGPDGWMYLATESGRILRIVPVQ